MNEVNKNDIRESLEYCVICPECENISEINQEEMDAYFFTCDCCGTDVEIT